MHAPSSKIDLVDKELSRRILERDLWCKGYVMHFLRDGGARLAAFTTVDSLQLYLRAQPERDRRIRAQ